MNNSEIKENITLDIYKIIEKRGRIKLWECFGYIKDENDIELINFVAVKICGNVYKYNKNSMSNLSKHKCYELIKNEKGNKLIKPAHEAKKACTDAITECVLGDIRPCTLVKDSELREYSKLMLPLGNKFGSNQKEINPDLSPVFGKI